jgi:cephalosporin-C deacetylase-like acetyl esterase
MRALLLLSLLLAGPARAADDLSVFKADEQAAGRRMLRDYLLGEAKKHFAARRAAVAALKTPADLRGRQQALRARFLAALGSWPAKTPLNARVVGKVRGKGYTVEKVVYESRPGSHVTANFYLPDGKGPFPAVLMPVGHNANGKCAESVQRGAISLARHGIAAFAYDPIGQGERFQLLGGDGKPLLGGTSEHTLVGVGALLVGWNTASYRVWDGVRGLDYLCGRPDVDGKRLGCTGCSGGGTLTSYLMALDDRIKAAAPSCYITSLERLFDTLGPQDAEQNITGQVAFGMDHADYLSMRAPRATLVCCSTQDFFDIKGTWESYREAKKLYTLAGRPERLDIVESEGKHGFHTPQRVAMLRWMRRWLLGRDDAPVEEDARPLPDAELRCTRTGQVLDSLGGVSVFQVTARRAKELAARRARELRTTGDLRVEVARRIGLGPRVARARVEERVSLARAGCHVRKLLFRTEAGILVPALRFAKDEKARGPVVLYVCGEGKAADAGPGGPIEKLVQAGSVVLAVDLRGFGETAPGPSGTSYFGADLREAFLALHLDRPLLGQRVGDLLAVVRQLPEQARGGLHVVGVGKGAPVVLHAAALEPAIARVTLRGMVLSWEAVASTPVGRDQLTNVVPGALAAYDLPDLAVLAAPRPLAVLGPVDPAGKAVSVETLKNSWARVRAAYAARRAGKDLTLEGR